LTSLKESFSTICTRSDLRRKPLLLPNYETGKIGFQFAFLTLPGGNYDQVSLPTLKKVARALSAEIEITLSE
jgi:hypothetical protein